MRNTMFPTDHGNGCDALMVEVRRMVTLELLLDSATLLLLLRWRCWCWWWCHDRGRWSTSERLIKIYAIGCEECGNGWWCRFIALLLLEGRDGCTSRFFGMIRRHRKNKQQHPTPTKHYPAGQKWKSFPPGKPTLLILQ